MNSSRPVRWCAEHGKRHLGDERPLTEPILTRFQFDEMLARAKVTAVERGLPRRPNGMFYSAEFGVFGIGFGPEHSARLGNPWVYLDGKTGRGVSAQVPGAGTFGDFSTTCGSRCTAARSSGCRGASSSVLPGLSSPCCPSPACLSGGADRGVSRAQPSHLRRPCRSLREHGPVWRRLASRTHHAA